VLIIGRLMQVKRRAIFLSWIFACQSLHAALAERSVSPSHQFVIYGADVVLRGGVSNLAEQTKANLLALLQQRDGWKIPVLINLQPRQANLPEIPPAELHVSQTGFGPKLQLDLTIAQDLDASLMERELLHVILLEVIYRNQPNVAPRTAFLQPPDWLLDGILAFTPGRDRRSLVEALSAADKTLPLAEFLMKRPELLDSAGRLIYRAYSFALVQLLIDGADGRARLSRYIGNLSNASNDPLADLKAQFAVLANHPDKIWCAAVARLSGAENYQLFTFSESERRLDELLRVKVPGTDKSAELASFVRQKSSPAEKAALKQLSQALLLFIGQANPVLRPVAREYQQAATLLARGKRRGVAKRLARLQLTREKLSARMNDIDDYINWFEATQMENGSGNFTDYLKAANQSLRSAPRRRDPLSVYLDSLADQFED
jgi:hypothetical protein